ncbi:NtaA/DmoA family FMN-dependent monooxygenase [Streptomyces mirabilis]|uniref:NtaA/DmoA family FMN-dependent monooxygenase n=1 Tax=Streptomyces mirabilis TaxID=68239 RepID=UPI0033308257
MPNAQYEQMHLFLFVAPVGYQTAAWRHTESRVEDLYSFDLQADIARRAEAAKLHALFLADWLSFEDTGKNPDLTGYEPFTTLGALAAVTENIGLVATASTTFNEPFNLARYFSQLDFLSKGRVGWNIVTSTTGEENFTIDLPPREERYARAVEYMDVVTGLWDAWEDDAVIADRERGVWARRDKIHTLNHKGEHYRVEGPLFVPRSPQAWPVLVQAGASSSGMDFAAKFAEAVFTVKPTLESAREFYSGLATRTLEGGRAKPPIILPGLMPIVGDTEAQALEIHDSLSDLIDRETGIRRLAKHLHNADLADLDLDDRVPAERLIAPDQAEAQGAPSRYRFFHDLAVSGVTVRNLIRESSKADGHGVFTGTPVQIADHMETWFHGGTADGFAILPPTVPAGLQRFLDDVVPILQERGSFRTDYIPGTFRDNLGLERPKSPHQP